MTVVVGGQGDVTDPNAWQDAIGNVPPFQYNKLPAAGVNFPLNGDGRYWFQGNNHTATTGVPITFIGDPGFKSTGSVSLQWSIYQAATDGSIPQLASLTSGAVWTTATLTGAGAQLGGIQSG